MKPIFLLTCCLLLGGSARAQLFSDNFTRGSDPGPLSPWIVQAGTWTVTGGTMQSGTNALFSYGDANITNNWTNFTVQARFRFQSNSFGGGLGGRLDTASGAHYAAWVYPENSPAGSNVLRLIKFQSLTSFGYNGTPFAYMASTNLASVGTNFHTLRMDLQGSQINVYFDGVQRISTTDIESTYYTNGSVSLDMWTDSTGYLMVVDDLVVNGLQLTANADSFTAVAGLQLSVPAPGVLGNDTGGNGPLSAFLVSGVSHGTLSLSNNGGFTYTATSSYTGPDSFTYRVNDGSTNATNTVSLTVTPDHPPVAVGDSYTVQINSFSPSAGSTGQRHRCGWEFADCFDCLGTGIRLSDFEQ
jgi:VCBS repeat-containing protein